MKEKIKAFVVGMKRPKMERRVPALFAAVVLMGFYGMTIDTPFVASVEAGAPADEAGLQAGDVFVSVRGKDMTGLTVNEVSAAIGDMTQGAEVDLTVRRGEEMIELSIVPEYSEQEGRYLIGIMIQQGYDRLPAGNVIPAAWDLCVQASHAILDALGKLVTTGEGIDQTSGPVGVVQMVAEQTQQGGMEVYLYLLVIISINLGLMNLIPIPGLDGSRLVFMVIEAIRRKPVSQKVEAVIHLCGYALLFGLMLFFTFKDVLRIFQH